FLVRLRSILSTTMARIPRCTSRLSRGPAATELDTLSLHDALPIFVAGVGSAVTGTAQAAPQSAVLGGGSGLVFDNNSACSLTAIDRKSTRLNSSHVKISYAVFCLKKKTTTANRA